MLNNVLPSVILLYAFCKFENVTCLIYVELVLSSNIDEPFQRILPTACCIPFRLLSAAYTDRQAIAYYVRISLLKLQHF